MENGMMIATNYRGSTSAVFIEEEVLELDRLNNRTKVRIRKTQQKEKHSIKQARKHNHRLQKLVVRVAATVAVSAGVAMAQAAGLMTAALGIPLLVAAMVYVSFLIGQYLGRCCK